MASRSAAEPEHGPGAADRAGGAHSQVPDPGLAAERTRLAWARTALAFGAVGGIILRTSVVPGLVVLATGPVIYVLGVLARPDADAVRTASRLRLVTATIIFVAVVGLAVAVFAPGRR